MGAIAFGSATGLTTSLALFLVLGIGGVVTSTRTGPLLVVVYVSQFIAGYVAGRFAAGAGALHGGLAALVLFSITAVLSLAGGTRPTFVTLAFSLVVAAVIGSAGGVLADWRRLETG